MNKLFSDLPVAVAYHHLGGWKELFVHHTKLHLCHQYAAVCRVQRGSGC